MNDRRTNLALQGLRGVAALAVLLYQASEYLSALRGDARFLTVFSGLFGAFGVAAFFAMSGYLMARVLERGDSARFLLNRIARIYPAMLLHVALFALLFAVTGSPRGINAISLTLVPAGPKGYFLGVEWTLVFEVTYYVALATLGLIGLGRFRTLAVAIWACAIIAAFFWGSGRTEQLLPTLSQMPLSIVNLPFALGYLVATLQRRNLLPPHLIWPAIAFAVAAYKSNDLPDIRLLTGLSSAFLIAALVKTQPHSDRPRLQKLVERIGDASYCLYLCHVSIILIGSQLLPTASPGWLVWMIWVAGAVAFALAMGPVDIAMHHRLKSAVGRLSARSATILACLALAGFAAIAVDAEFDRHRTEEARERAIRALSGPLGTAGANIRGEIDPAVKLPNGRWVLRGYAIDLERPQIGTLFALKQAGRLLVLSDRPRLRPQVAAALGRPDLKDIRFGFFAALPEGFDCKNGPLEGVIAFDDGRAFALPGDNMAAICAP